MPFFPIIAVNTATIAAGITAHRNTWVPQPKPECAHIHIREAHFTSNPHGIRLTDCQHYVVPGPIEFPTDPE